jgi:uncharacterized glyoxalase superfamily protein PhnB
MDPDEPQDLVSVVDDPVKIDRRILHAPLRFNDQLLMLGDERPATR